MVSAIEDLTRETRGSRYIDFLVGTVANTLRKFESNETPIVYDQEKDYSYKRSGTENKPKEFDLLECLGLVDDIGRPYDWDKFVLNARARDMYDRLCQEGYYQAIDSKPL